MPALPSRLVPLAASYALDDPGGVMRTEVEGGASRFALDWDRGPQRFHVSLLMDALQFSVWTAFYFHLIKKGAIAFDMPLDSGYGADTHSVNIMPGSYSAARASHVLWSVSFEVEAESEVFEMSVADAEDLIALYEEYGPSSDELLARIDQFANVDTLVLDL